MDMVFCKFNYWNNFKQVGIALSIQDFVTWGSLASYLMGPAIELE